MDIADLRALVAFADAGCNLTVAGTAIAVSQPAMHARLSGLARELAVTLYQRRGRTLELTPGGTRVLAWARDVLDREHQLRADLVGAAPDGRVVLACGEGALVHVVGDRVAAWLRAHPGRLGFLVVDGPSAAEAVRRGDANLAVVAGPASQTPDLRTVPLLTTSLCAVAPRRHPTVRDAHVDLPTLLGHPLLLPPVGRPLRTTFEDAATAHGVPLRIAAELGSWEAVARLSKLGVGVGIINDVIATPGLGRAVIRGLPPTTYRVLTRRGRPTSGEQELLDALHRA